MWQHAIDVSKLSKSFYVLGLRWYHIIWEFETLLEIPIFTKFILDFIQTMKFLLFSQINQN